MPTASPSPKPRSLRDRVFAALSASVVLPGAVPDEEEQVVLNDLTDAVLPLFTAEGTEAHPPVHRWRAEILDSDEWMPASSTKKDRAEVLRLLRVGATSRPAWDDGTPVQRRLVRETTSYTVEPTSATEGTDRP